MVQRSFLEYMVHHVFLPPGLPQSDDSDVDKEQQLVERYLNALQLFQKFFRQEERLPWQSCIKMVSKMLEMRESNGDLSAAVIDLSLKNLVDGDTLAFYVRSQNAGLMVRTLSDQCCFESFEILPTNSAVMENAGRLHRRFPGPAIAIDRHRIADPNFRMRFAQLLACLDSEILEQACPVVEKAGSTVREIRDTTNPMFVTEMVTGMLRAMGQPIEIVRMQKNTRDEVLWKDTLAPWRRSPVWLFLRITLQRNLMLQHESDEAHAWYKSFMIFFMSTVLQSAVQAALPSDVLFAMVAKVSRRVLKLQMADEGLWLHFVNDTVIQAHQKLSKWWKSFEHVSAVTRETTDWHILRSSFMLDSNLSLLSLEPFVTKFRRRIALAPARQNVVFDSCPRISQSDHALPKLGSAEDTAYGGIHLALADVEKWVCDSLTGWLDKNLRHDEAALSLSELLEHYRKLATEKYADSPEDFSRMVLTIMELWIALDKCVLVHYALLRDYDPGFPPSLFDPLLLPWRSMMERLALVQQYLIQRTRNARLDCPSILKSVNTSQSFPVRYFETSPKHKALRQAIESAANSERAAKRGELEEKQRRYRRLMQESDALLCQYVNLLVGGRHIFGHAGNCRKCELRSQAKNISIVVHEWPLPTTELEARAAVFELDVPAAICKWRNITYSILVDTLSPKSTVDKSRRHKSRRHKSGKGRVYPIHEYVGLKNFFNSWPGRLQLVSSTKPFVISHYASQKASVASEESICVENGLKYALYDSTTGQTPQNLLDRCNICAPCTMKLPAGPYQSLQYAVDDTVHTPNEVIAKQAHCPETLTTHEYFAFASLRSGCRLQWRNIARELIARTLNFECEELYILIVQTIWQAGPGQPVDILRDSHQDLEETSFANSLISVLEDSLSNVEENWRGIMSVRILVALASRILTFSVSETLQHRCCAFLKRARNATLRWTRELCDKFQHAETEDESQELKERVLEAALTCYTTFDVDPNQLSNVIQSDDDLAVITECAILVHDQCPVLDDDLPNSIQMLLRRARRLAHCLETILRERILISPDGLDLTIHRIWPGYFTGTRWRALDEPKERWLVTETSPRDGALSVTIHFNLLTGSLLVSGVPLTRLPSFYELHPLYQRLFGKKIFDVVLSNMEGMVYATRGEIFGSQVHFGFYGSELIIRSQRGNKIYEVLPMHALRGDFPESFLEDYTHWLDIGSNDLEWRPLHNRWTSSRLNWHMQNTSSSPHYLRRGPLKLLDVRSSTVEDISTILAPLEYAQHIHVIFDDQDDSLLVHLPRLRLDFFLDKSSQLLQSKQYRGMYVDPSQSLGTLKGLFNKLILRNESNSERCMLIPHGKVLYQPHDRHVQVSIDTSSFQSVAHHFYTIDTQLGRLKDNGSLMSQLFKYYLHAVTAHCLPDDLTGRTGTEEALLGIRAAATRSFLDLDPSEVDLLRLIADLTPRRRYYPQHLRVMQETGWNNLSPLSQHNSFLEIVELIMSQASKFHLFQSEPAVLPDVNKGSDPVLTQRASVRDSTFYVEGFGAEKHTTEYDFDYSGRDDLSPGSLEHQVYRIAILTDEWSTNLNVCGDLMSEIESWQLAISGPDMESLEGQFGYDKKLLKMITTWLPKEWCSLQVALSQSSPERDKYGIMIFLSTLIYSQRASPGLARSFLAFATVPQLRRLRPPSYPLFELAHGYRPDRGRLLGLIEQHVRPYHECPEAFLGPLPAETTWDAGTRLREAHETAQQERVETLVSAFMEQWPRETAYSPTTTDCGVYIFTKKSVADVSAWFQSWYWNEKFKTYISQVQQVLNSLMGMEPSAQPYLIPKVWHAGVRRSTYVRFGDISQSATPTYFSEPSFFRHTLLTQKEGQPGIQSSLRTLLRRLSVQSSTKFEKKYVEDLLKSFESLNMETSFILSESSVTLLKFLEEYLQECRKHTQNFYQSMCHSLRTGIPSTLRMVCEVGMWPRTPPAFFLCCLASQKFATLSNKWQKCLLSYGLSFCALQRAQRLVQVVNKTPEFIEELRNTGHLGWDPASKTDWLLFEIENNLLIRQVQAQVAMEMIKPSSGKNSVLQLGMGEGKSSVIVPIVAATLANGKELARVLVLKPLANQMFHLLVQKLGGMLDRPVFYMPFSRSLRLDVDRANQICDLYKECARARGILLLQPEHLLSFELMGPERLYSGQNKLGRVLVQTQYWLETHSRDILDESDEILSVRFELVYTIGTQQTTELSPDRWSIIQHVLGMVDSFSEQLLQQYPQSLEKRPSKPGRFSLVRILQPSSGVKLVNMVAREVCEKGVPGVPIWTFPQRKRASLFILLTQAHGKVGSFQSLNFGTDSVEKSLLLLRALFAGGIITFAFHRKRWRVNYGLHLSRSMLAVPYHAKDIPAARAEFSHPDVTIVLTCLSYYHGGLSDEQLYTAFKKLLLSDQAEEEYQRWVHDAPELQSAFRQLRGINLKNDMQCRGQVFPPLRYAKGAIDFYLSSVVFPREMKEFPHKMSASGWNIARIKAHPTTGFSGTNDSRYVLPLSIEQSDLPQQRNTNASVLNCLLKSGNSFQSSQKDSTSPHLDATSLLNRVVASNIPTRVILDVGAQVLEMQNQDFALSWLLKLPQMEAQAAIFFDENNELSVVNRDNVKERLMISPFAKQMDQCLVYLDESHTRGTDLKLPSNYRAAVTLGPDLTKDRLVQACLRMRKLGRGQSIMFCGPVDVEQQILELSSKSQDDVIDVSDVLTWSIANTYSYTRRCVELWASQGMRYQRHHVAWSEPLSSGNGAIPTNFANSLLEAEAQTIKQRYGLTARPLNSQVIKRAREEIKNQRKDQFDAIQRKCQEFSVASFDNATLQEEQERELSPQNEEERQVQRPPPLPPYEHRLSPDVVCLIRQGIFRRSSDAFEPAFKTLLHTSAAPYLEAEPWPELLLATQDFGLTVKRSGRHLLDFYLRPAQWVISHVEAGEVTCILLSPFEVQHLLPDIRKFRRVTLHVYSPRVVASARSLDDLSFCAVPEVRPNWSPPLVVTHLNLFAGQLYSRDYLEYLSVCRFLGLCHSPPANGVDVNCEGFVAPSSRARYDTVMENTCSFSTSPLGLLRILMDLRRQGQGFSKSHYGKITSGELLTKRDFEELPSASFGERGQSTATTYSVPEELLRGLRGFEI